jgi:excinuclease UvrABC nuclease subunit
LPIRKDWTEFTAENVAQAPETDGVYELSDEESNIVYIKGTTNLRQSLEENLNGDEPCLAKVRNYRYEETFMYTLRESELIQQFVRKNSRMPEGNMEII